MKKIALLFLVLMIGCTTTGNIVREQACWQVEVPYQANETYLAKEPYIVTEEYNVSLKYKIIETFTTGSFAYVPNYMVRGIIRLKNTDTEEGIFKVEMRFLAENRTKNISIVEKSIKAGKIEAFTHYYDVDYGEKTNFVFYVTPPQRTLVRNATRYRDVEQNRTVIRYRSELRCY